MSIYVGKVVGFDASARDQWDLRRGAPSPANPVAEVQRILRRDLRDTDLEELCDSELAEMAELLAHWFVAARDLLATRSDGPGKPAGNPVDSARFGALAQALDAVRITDTIGPGIERLRTVHARLIQVGRWIDQEMEDRTQWLDGAE